MGKMPHVDRSREEKWQIVQRGMKSGNNSETCRGWLLDGKVREPRKARNRKYRIAHLDRPRRGTRSRVQTTELSQGQWSQAEGQEIENKRACRLLGAADKP